MTNNNNLIERKNERIKFLNDLAETKWTIKHNPNCNQPIKYTDNCQKIHIYNICAEYPTQFCKNCFFHWSSYECKPQQKIITQIKITWKPEKKIWKEKWET